MLLLRPDHRDALRLRAEAESLGGATMRLPTAQARGQSEAIISTEKCPRYFLESFNFSPQKQNKKFRSRLKNSLPMFLKQIV